MKKKVFPAQLEYLHEMLNFIQTYGASQNIPHDLTDKIILATEEALVNVINYGYPDQTPDGTVEITCQESEKQHGLKIIIKDQGVPFNPVEQAPPPKSPTDFIKSEDKAYALGGYGIYIFVGIMDRVEYQRTDGGNILTLVKYF